MGVDIFNIIETLYIIYSLEYKYVGKGFLKFIENLFKVLEIDC